SGRSSPPLRAPAAAESRPRRLPPAAPAGSWLGPVGGQPLGRHRRPRAVRWSSPNYMSECSLISTNGRTNSGTMPPKRDFRASASLHDLYGLFTLSTSCTYAHEAIDCGWLGEQNQRSAALGS